MDANEITHKDVQFGLHRDEERGRYLFGAILNGEFVPLLEHKLGRIDKHAARGQQRQQEQQQPQQ